MASPPVVLVSDMTGFIGAAVTLDLLQRSYIVKGVVASEDEADVFFRKYPWTTSSIACALSPDLGSLDAFSDLLDGVDYVLHVGAPPSSEPSEKTDGLRRTLNWTDALLKAAARQPTVKHVTMTSSFCAVARLGEEVSGHTYTAEDWNDITYHEAVSAPAGLDSLMDSAFEALTEKAAWNFVEEEKPHFGFTTFCPTTLIGPPIQAFGKLEQLSGSCAELWSIICGKQQYLSYTPCPYWIDVRDVAKLHVDSFNNPKARNQRYLCSAGTFSYSQVAYIILNAFPEQAPRVARGDNIPPDVDYRIDCSKVKRDFCFKPISLERCVTDMARVLYAKEKEERVCKYVQHKCIM